MLPSIFELKTQAKCWKIEARAYRSIVHECYQLCSGSTGEPGDWNGAEPVRAVVAERDWLRNALEHIAGSCEGRAADVARAALMGPNAKARGSGRQADVPANNVSGLAALLAQEVRR